MFRELTMEEKIETEGGALSLIAKVVIGIVVTVFTAGSLKGCTDEAAKNTSNNSVSSGDASY